MKALLTILILLIINGCGANLSEEIKTIHKKYRWQRHDELLNKICLDGWEYWRLNRPRESALAPRIQKGAFVQCEEKRGKK